MAGRGPQRLTQLFKSIQMPRRPVRLRLTLLYSGLFLASSAVLLAITYVVVRNLTGGPYVSISKHGLTISGVRVGAPPPGASGGAALSGSGQVTRIAAGSGAGAPRLTTKQVEAQARELQRVAVLYHNS